MIDDISKRIVEFFRQFSHVEAEVIDIKEEPGGINVLCRLPDGEYLVILDHDLSIKAYYRKKDYNRSNLNENAPLSSITPEEIYPYQKKIVNYGPNDIKTSLSAGSTEAIENGAAKAARVYETEKNGLAEENRKTNNVKSTSNKGSAAETVPSKKPILSNSEKAVAVMIKKHPGITSFDISREMNLKFKMLAPILKKLMSMGIIKKEDEKFF